MSVRALLILFALVATITCVFFVLLPAFSLARFGASGGAQTLTALQLAGAMFGGLALMAWRARDAAPSTSQSAMLSGFFALNAIATAVTVVAARSGAFNRMAWVPVVVFALFTVGFLRAGRGSSSDAESALQA